MISVVQDFHKIMLVFQIEILIESSKPEENKS